MRRPSLVTALALLGILATVWLLRWREDASDTSTPPAIRRPSLERTTGAPATIGTMPPNDRAQTNTDRPLAIVAGAHPAASKTPRERARRRRADTVRRRVAQRKAKARNRQRGRHDETAPPPERAALSPKQAAARRRYIGDTIREQYFPVARSCYDELLARQPKAEGRVVVSFDVVGYQDAGVIDHVELTDETTIDDPEFQLCMRESMYTSVFEAPPPDMDDTTVVFPVELSP